MRSILLPLMACGLCAQAPAPAELQHYERALAGHRFEETSAVVDKLIHERIPADGKPHHDALLNAMIGRLYLIGNREADAANYLDHAPIAELPLAMRAPTALDHGRALELRGDREAALAAYREALDSAQDDEQRRRAHIGIARQLLPQDPAAAREQLLPIANAAAAPARWEARYLLAAASSLLGDVAAASKWADSAWADAAAAPPADLAPLRVATLRAGIAAAAHDLASERAMLTAANGLSVTATAWLSAQLPICGDDGLRPSDYVIFGFASGPYRTRELLPIAASRPEAVRPFADKLLWAVPIEQGASGAPVGTVFTLRCRTLVDQNFIARPVSGDPLVAWTIDHGLYPASVSYETDNDHLNAIDEWIAKLTARFGKDSPLLLMPRWQVMTILEARAMSGEPIVAGQIADAATQVAAGLRRAGAPEWLPASIELRSRFEQLVQSGDTSTDPAATIQELMRKQLLDAPFDLSRQMVVGMVAPIHDKWPAQVSQFVLDLDAKAPASLAGRERQAWKLTVAAALRSSARDSQARATIAAAGLPNAICAAADSPPKVLEQHFSYNDYPQELITNGQEGSVLFEFDLSKSGTVSTPRVLYSLPSGIFDEVSAKGLPGVRYTAPEFSGKPSSCHGVYQPITWRLESSSYAVPQTLQPPTPEE
jgi:hypothetical protein